MITAEEPESMDADGQKNTLNKTQAFYFVIFFSFFFLLLSRYHNLGKYKYSCCIWRTCDRRSRII